MPIIDESSEHLEESSAHLKGSSAHLRDSSAHSNRAEEGWLIVSGIANPLIDDLQLLTSEVKQELAAKANEVQSRKKSRKLKWRELFFRCAKAIT